MRRKNPSSATASRRREPVVAVRRNATRTVSAPTSQSASAAGADSDLAGPEAVARHLGEIILWGRVHSFGAISRRANVRIDRSGIIVLATLARLGPMRVSELAADIGLDHSTISRQVSAAVRSGYIEKYADERDARVSLLRLTPQGDAVRKKLAAGWSAIVTDILAAWRPGDTARLGEYLRAVAAQLPGG